MVKRDFKLSADISVDAKNKLIAICDKYDFSRGKMLERMINKFHGDVFKEGKSPTKKKEINLPEGLNLHAWGLWIDYRKKIKKPLKTAGQAKNLIKLGETMEGQMAVVMQSINNEYQGLFKVKANETDQQTINGKFGRKPTAVEANNERLLKQYGNASAHNERPINPTSDSGMDQHQVHRGLRESMEQHGVTIDMGSGNICDDSGADKDFSI